MSEPSDMPRARGMAEFVRAGLLRAGGRKMDKNTKGWVYISGPFRGKTEEQATAEIESMWHRMGDADRSPWENRAYGTEGPMERAASRPVAPVAATPAVAPPAPTPVDNRPNDDKVRSRPEVAAAYAAKRAGKPTIALPRARQVDDGAAMVPGRVEGPVKDFRGEALAKMPVPDGLRVMGDTEADAAGAATGRRINTLTGLPFGHDVGAALPAGADAAMRARAEASVMRQKSAVAAPVIAADLRPSPDAVRADRAAAAQKFNAYSDKATTGPVTMADAEGAREAWEAKRTAGGPVTMGDLEKSAGGAPVSEAAKWGVRPDGGQLTRDDVRIPGVVAPAAVAAVRRRKPVRPIAFGL